MSPRQHPAPHAPTLAELQQRVDAWIGQFEEGYWPPLSMLARLTEEVGELAREINHDFGHKPKKPNEPAGEIALEVADIIFVLVCLCNSLHIDLGDAFERVMQKYDARDSRRWTRRMPEVRARTPLAPRAPRSQTPRANAPRAPRTQAPRPKTPRSAATRKTKRRRPS